MNVKLSKVLAGAFALLALAACAGTPPPDPSASIQSDADAYYLIAVQPDKAVISLATGSVRDGAYYADGTVLVTQTFGGSPVDGFVLAKAPPGTTQGIRIMRLTDSPWASVYVPCLTDVPTLVLDTIGGKVAYGGSVWYGYSGSVVVSRYGDDIEAARNFLARHYPQLVDKLVPTKVQHVPAKRC